MKALTEFNFSLELSTLILAGLIFLILLGFLVYKGVTKGKVEIEGLEIGLGNVSFCFSNDKAARQIAYKIWVEINTRVLGVKIDLEKDIIRAIHQSYYEFFKAVRLLIEEIPANNLKNTKTLIDLSISFLNEVIRPYLTKWGIKFNEWYDEEKTNGNHLVPTDIQKRFKEYDELSSDLLSLNEKVINYSAALHKIAFKEKGK